MIRAFFVLVLALAGWWATLWLLIAPDLSQWRLPQLVALHAGPPLGAWGIWVFWRGRRRERAAIAAAEREAAADKERQIKQEEARQQHAAERQRLRYGCDCLMVALAQVPPTGSSPALVPGGDAICVLTLIAESDSSAESTLLDHLRPGVKEVLGAIYGRCPAATAFPIYVSPPAESIGEEVVTCLREVRASFVADLGSPVRSGPEFDTVLFLPSRDSAADSVIGLFEANPDLPGAVILAFDSPWWRGRMLESDEWDSADAGKAEQRKWQGLPAQGVFALLVTNPQLPEMLAALPRSNGQHDALTPYWERNPAAAGRVFLSVLSESERDALLTYPPLARIHRAVSTQFGQHLPGSMAFARGIEAQIERAQIYAALIDLPFDSSDGSARASEFPPEAASPDCLWLVHNAGGIDRAGNRLAALGVALFRRGLEVDPIAAATNVTVAAGDLGQARSVAMLAMTVAQAASGEGAALCAEFFAGSDLSLFFATAPKCAA